MAERKDGSYHVALASSTRRRVLDALAESSIPLDAQAIATVLDLHITTVRFHLDHLEEAHLVRRESESRASRGRPRILYRPEASERADSSREQLIDVLAGAIAVRDGGDSLSRSVEAGRRWANALASERSASSGDVTLIRVLNELGFDPKSDGEDVIHLRACPFRDAARSHPEVVCSVHRGLVERVLERTDSARVDSARLLPFVEPELCLITLGHNR